MDTNEVRTFVFLVRDDMADVNDLTCAVMAPVANCSAPSEVSAAYDGVPVEVTVRTSGTAGSGNVTLHSVSRHPEHMSGTGSIWIDVVPQQSAAWVVTLGTVLAAVPAGGIGSVRMTVTNSGDASGTLQLEGGCDPGLTDCTVSPSAVSLAPGGSATLTVSFTAGPIGTPPRYVYVRKLGEIPYLALVNVTSQNELPTGCESRTVVVWPCAGSDSAVVLGTGGTRRARFSVGNMSTVRFSGKPYCYPSTGVATCHVVNEPAGVLPGSIAHFEVEYTMVSGATSGTIIGGFTRAPGWEQRGDQAQGSMRVVVRSTSDAFQPLSIDLTAAHMEGQSSIVCAPRCYDHVTRVLSAAHVSRGRARQIALTYSSAQAAPMVLLPFDLRAPVGIPQQVSVRLRRPDGTYITFANGSTELFYSMADSVGRVVLQVDTRSLSTGVTRATLEVRVDYIVNGVTTSRTSHESVRLLVANEQSGLIGQGWGVEGFQQTISYADSVFLKDGDGTVQFYRRAGQRGDTTYYWSPFGEFSTLRRIDGNLRRRFLDGREYVFDPTTGAIQNAVDETGDTTRFQSTGSGGAARPTVITDPAGIQSVFAYGTPGLSTITTLGRELRIVRNASLAVRIDRITDAQNQQLFAATYDATLGLMQTEAARTAGAQWTYSYNWLRQLVSRTSPSYPTESGSSTTSGSILPWDTAGAVRSGTQEGTLAVKKLAVPRAGVYTDVAGVRKWENASGLDTLVRDRASGLTRMVRSVASGGLSLDSMVHPTGARESFSYVGPLRLLYRDAQGRQNRYVYEEGGVLLLEQHSSDGPILSLIRGQRGRVESVRLGSGRPTSFVYDSLNRVVLKRDGSNVETRMTYSGRYGNADSLKLPFGGVIVTTYDFYGRDSVRLATTTGQASGTLYDADNRLVQRHDSIGAVPWRYLYGSNGRLDRAIDPRGLIYKFASSGSGLVERTYATDDTMKFERLGYSAFGEVVSLQNRRAGFVRWRNDALGRGIAREVDGAPIDSFRYAPDGRHFRAWNAIASHETFTGAGGVMDSTVYTVRGNRIALVNIRPDSFVLGGLQFRSSSVPPLTDRIISRAQGGGQNATFGVGLLRLLGDNFGRATRADFNNTSSTVSLTIAGTPIEMNGGVSDLATSEDMSVLYGYDSAGRIVERAVMEYANGVGSYAVETYAFNSLGKLREIGFGHAPSCGTPHLIRGHRCAEVMTVDSVHAVNFDASGNREDAAVVHMGGGNRLLRFGDDSLEYDSDGNVTSHTVLSTGRTVRYGWNASNRLQTITYGDTTVTLGYDALGRIATLDRNGVPYRSLVWNGAQLIAVFDGSMTTKIAEYLYSGLQDQPFAIVTGSASNETMRRLFYDAAGSLVVAGSWCSSGCDYWFKRDLFVNYDVWGNARASGVLTDSVHFGYKGHLTLNLGLPLVRMGARWYDPRTGRFLSEDPAGLAGGENLYAFAAGDPVNRHDPSGRSPHCFMGYCFGSRDAVFSACDDVKVDLIFFAFGGGCGGEQAPTDGATLPDGESYTNWWEIISNDVASTSARWHDEAHDFLDDFAIGVKADAVIVSAGASVTPTGAGQAGAGLTQPTANIGIALEGQYSFREPVGQTQDIMLCPIACAGVVLDRDGTQAMKIGIGLGEWGIIPMKDLAAPLPNGGQRPVQFGPPQFWTTEGQLWRW